MMQDLEKFLVIARAAYEEAKINYNTGKCTAAQLENVRISLERVERAALALPRSNSPEQDSASAGLQSQSGINRSLSEGTPREGVSLPRPNGGTSEEG